MVALLLAPATTDGAQHVDFPVTSPLEQADTLAPMARQVRGDAIASGTRRGSGMNVIGCGVVLCSPGRLVEDGARSNARPVTWWTMARLESAALYTPRLDAATLRPILASHPPRVDGHAAVTFCVDACGRVRNVHTARPVPGLPELDALLRRNVRKWRVHPSVMAEQPTLVCARHEVDFGEADPDSTIAYLKQRE